MREPEGVAVNFIPAPAPLPRAVAEEHLLPELHPEAVARLRVADQRAGLFDVVLLTRRVREQAVQRLIVRHEQVEWRRERADAGEAGESRFQQGGLAPERKGFQ